MVTQIWCLLVLICMQKEMIAYVNLLTHCIFLLSLQSSLQDGRWWLRWRAVAPGLIPGWWHCSFCWGAEEHHIEVWKLVRYSMGTSSHGVECQLVRCNIILNSMNTEFLCQSNRQSSHRISHLTIAFIYSCSILRLTCIVIKSRHRTHTLCWSQTSYTIISGPHCRKWVFH